MSRSKQLLPLRGRLHLSVRITDQDGDMSVQEGTAWGDNVKEQYEILQDHAVYSAIYKHYSKFGYQGFKGDQYDVADLTSQIEILDYWVDYGEEKKFLKVKRQNVNGKYETYVYSDEGKVLHRYAWRNKKINKNYFSQG